MATALLSLTTKAAVSIPRYRGGGGGDDSSFLIPRHLVHHHHQRDDSNSGAAAATVMAIMPQSVSCAGRGDECTTAAVAAPYLVDAMYEYGVVTGYEQAGILALIAYESVEMRYKVNQNAANRAAGQGTANE